MMVDVCVVICALTGVLFLTLLGLQLLHWIGETYMDLRNTMVTIKYGEKKIRYLNEHWEEVRKCVEEMEAATYAPD